LRVSVIIISVVGASAHIVFSEPLACLVVRWNRILTVWRDIRSISTWRSSHFLVVKCGCVFAATLSRIFNSLVLRHIAVALLVLGLHASAVSTLVTVNFFIFKDQLSLLLLLIHELHRLLLNGQRRKRNFFVLQQKHGNNPIVNCVIVLTLHFEFC
jgi:hypothetical protein